MASTRIVIVDDHLLFREGIREILEAEPTFEVVGEAGDSMAAVDLIAAQQPDVVLLDVDIPGERVTWTVARIGEVSPRSKIIILSMSDGPRLVLDLVDMGVHGYLLKSVSRHELVAVVRTAQAANDRMVLSVSRDTLRRLAVADTMPMELLTTEPCLAERETEVLRLTAQALSNAQIASMLDLTEATVKRHLRNIFAKLGAVSRIDAVNRGVAAGLISSPHTPASGSDRPEPSG